jgi:hypothetical protein
MNTNLIDRYIAEIGKHLPIQDRGDIQKEIRSTLEDMLEDRRAGREADEAMLVDLLREFGKPEDVAASYLPERRLIGPQMYPIFSLVAWIALPTLATVLLITLGIGLFSAEMTPLETLKGIGTLLLQVGQTLVTAFGSIVLTFAILERIFGTKEVKVEVLTDIPGIKVKGVEKEAWDPRNLPEVQDVEKFSIPGLAAEIVFTAAAIVVFNFFPQIVGFGVLHDNHWTFLPLLSEAFFCYLPFVNALWGLQIVLDLVLLRQGRWGIATRWLRAALLVAGIVLAAVMLAGPDLVVSAPGALTAAWPDLSAKAVRILTLLPRVLAKVVLGLSILGNASELLKGLLRQVNKLNR